MADISTALPRRHGKSTCTIHGKTSLRPSLLDLLALRRQRRALAKLDDSSLTDLGLTRAEALAESNRGFWDAPAHWLR